MTIYGDFNGASAKYDLTFIDRFENGEPILYRTVDLQDQLGFLFYRYQHQHHAMVTCTPSLISRAVKSNV